MEVVKQRLTARLLTHHRRHPPARLLNTEHGERNEKPRLRSRDFQHLNCLRAIILTV